MLSLSYGQIKIRPEESLHGLVPASFETYQLVDPDDIVCRPTDLQNDWNSLRFGLSRYRGIITSAYMRLRTRSILSRHYGYLLLHSYDLKKVFYGLGSGLRQNLSWSDFKLLPCLVPPLAEQRAIVRYLDHADRRIRRYVDAKRKLVDLLEEEKQAVINRAVTRGLDPDVRLKPSGVEWLGDMPAHWEMRRLRSLLADSNQRNRPDLPLLSVVRERGVITRDITNTDENHNYIPDDLSNYKVVKGGQFAMNKMKAWQGSYGVSPHDGIVSPAYYVFDVRQVDGVYFHTAIRSKAYVPFFAQASDGVRIGQWDLSRARMREIPFLLPPLSEQSAIAEHLDKATADIDSAIARAQRQIELVEEYRTRLVADVVTGKLDVREAAARLPGEGDEVEPIIEENGLHGMDQDLEKEPSIECEVRA